MTLHEISSQLYSLSVDGFFNREKFTKSQLYSYLSTMFSCKPDTGSTIIMEIALPDGWWIFSVSRYSSTADGFSYFIPDTREQETHVKSDAWDRYTKSGR